MDNGPGLVLIDVHSSSDWKYRGNHEVEVVMCIQPGVGVAAHKKAMEKLWKKAEELLKESFIQDLLDDEEDLLSDGVSDGVDENQKLPLSKAKLAKMSYKCLLAYWKNDSRWSMPGSKNQILLCGGVEGDSWTHSLNIIVI